MSPLCLLLSVQPRRQIGQAVSAPPATGSKEAQQRSDRQYDKMTKCSKKLPSQRAGIRMRVDTEAVSTRPAVVKRIDTASSIQDHGSTKTPGCASLVKAPAAHIVKKSGKAVVNGNPTLEDVAVGSALQLRNRSRRTLESVEPARRATRTAVEGRMGKLFRSLTRRLMRSSGPRELV